MSGAMPHDPGVWF